MAGNRSFAATNIPDTCLWCGRRLRVYLLDQEPRRRLNVPKKTLNEAMDQVRQWHAEQAKES